MARTLDSLAATVGGRVVEGSIPGSRRADSVVRLDDFHVASDSPSVTLVAGLPAEIRAAGTRLAGAVPLTSDDGHGWEGMTVLLGSAELGSAALHRWVESLLAADRAAQDRLVTLGTRVLTQVARRGGVSAVVAELAHRVDGWVVLLDNHGQTITTAGAGSLHVQDAAALALQRKVRVRHPGLQVHPVGEGGDPSAYLVISSRDASASSSRDLAAQAAALLDLVLRTHDHTVTERLGRELMMSTLLSARPTEARELLRRWGARDDSYSGFVISSRTRLADLDGLVTRWLDDLAVPQLVSAEGRLLVGLIRAESAPALASRVESVADETRVPLRCGIGAPAGVGALARTVADARQAFEVALAGARVVAHYDALPTVRLLLDHLGPEPTARLAVLVDGLGPELLETLRVFLAESGAWGVTASRLGVHRQTLSRRIERIEASTGLSMSDPDDRAAAWLAIRAVERGA